MRGDAVVKQGSREATGPWKVMVDDNFHYMNESERFEFGKYDTWDEAAVAHAPHRAQLRKKTSIPYISHLMAVTALVLEHGGSEDQAIAALLHDAAEDAGGAPTLDKIRATFGNAVADIVADCTDAWTEPKPPWRARKEAYIQALSQKPSSSLLVSLADKTHNAEAILNDFLAIGDGLWERFNGGAEGTRWYYKAMVDVFSERMQVPLSDRLSRAVEGFVYEPR